MLKGTLIVLYMYIFQEFDRVFGLYDLVPYVSTPGLFVSLILRFVHSRKEFIQGRLH